MGDVNGSSTTHVGGDRLDHLTATHVVVDRSAIRSMDADQAQMERLARQEPRGQLALQGLLARPAPRYTLV